MLKTVWTLMRGAAAAAEEEVVDRSALLILDQQIRDAATATERAKRALALAIAQDEAEGKHLEATLSPDRRSRNPRHRGARRAPGRPRCRSRGGDRDVGGGSQCHSRGARKFCARDRADESNRCGRDPPAGRARARPPHCPGRRSRPPAARQWSGQPFRGRRRSQRPKPRSGACARGRPRKPPPRQRCRPSTAPRRPTLPSAWKPPDSGRARGQPRPTCWRGCASGPPMSRHPVPQPRTTRRINHDPASRA